MAPHLLPFLLRTFSLLDFALGSLPCQQASNYFARSMASLVLVLAAAHLPHSRSLSFLTDRGWRDEEFHGLEDEEEEEGDLTRRGRREVVLSCGSGISAVSILKTTPPLSASGGSVVSQ